MRTGSAHGLDAAWDMVTAALPDRWRVHGIAERPGLSISERWEASAWGPSRGDRLYDYGTDPAAALRELAATLRRHVAESSDG